MCYVYVYNSDLSFDYFWKVVFGKIKILLIWLEMWK